MIRTKQGVRNLNALGPKHIRPKPSIDALRFARIVPRCKHDGFTRVERRWRSDQYGFNDYLADVDICNDCGEEIS